MKLSGILVVAGCIVLPASSVMADSSLVGTWIIPISDAAVAEVDVADIDVEVVYRVCNTGNTNVEVRTVASPPSNKPILKPLPVASCVDVTSHLSNWSLVYDHPFFVLLHIIIYWAQVVSTRKSTHAYGNHRAQKTSYQRTEVWALASELKLRSSIKTGVHSPSR